VQGSEKSNCLLGALAIRRTLGGKLKWRSPGRGFFGNPWGHFWVCLPNGSTASYSPFDKDLSPWGQLWFRGSVKIKESKLSC
jgi:hypothetical protein